MGKVYMDCLGAGGCDDLVRAKRELKKAEAILQEFFDDVEAVGASTTKAEWPDIHETYKKAANFLGEVPG